MKKVFMQWCFLVSLVGAFCPLVAEGLTELLEAFFEKRFVGYINLTDQQMAALCVFMYKTYCSRLPQASHVKSLMLDLKCDKKYWQLFSNQEIIKTVYRVGQQLREKKQ